MAALVKDDGSLVQSSFKVSTEGAKKLIRAIEKPKKPTAKLVDLMRERKEYRTSR